MTIRGIVFDLDGTLTDYERSAAAGLREAYRVLQRQVERPFSEFARAYQEVIRREQRLTSTTGIQHSADENRAIRFKKTLEHLNIHHFKDFRSLALAYGKGRAHGAPLFPGVKKTLQKLKKSYILGLLSEGKPETQLGQIRRHGISSFFTAILISGETEYHKPDIRLFSLMSERMKIPPGELMMVGDRVDWDLKPAKQLGMKTVLVDHSGKIPRDTHFPEVDGIIHSLAELPALLQRA